MSARIRAAIDLVLLLALVLFCAWLLVKLANPQTARQLQVTGFIHAIVHNVETRNPQGAVIPTGAEISPGNPQGFHRPEGA